MKKIVFFSLAITMISLIPGVTNAQLQKGNIMIGGDLASLNFNLGGSGYFQGSINPKLAFFVHDNFALGGMINFGLITSSGGGTTTSYGVSALGRYYLNHTDNDIVLKGRFFLEGNAGFQGERLPDKSNTTGLGLGIGPGYTYFVTQSVGLETLLKYNGIAGFGSTPYSSNLNLNIGFQIYLPGRKVKAMMSNVQ